MHSLLMAVLWPIRYAVEAVLVTSAGLLQRLGLPIGLGWVLAVPILLVLVRVLVLPLVIVAAKNAQRMVLLADAVAALRETLQAGTVPAPAAGIKEEIRRMRRRLTATQWKSLVPQLLQLPVLLSLSAVLQQADIGQAGAGPLTAPLAASFGDATIAGAPFRSTVLHDGQASAIGILLAIVAGVAVFAGQALALRFTITDTATRAPMWRFRPAPLFLAPPVVVLVSLTTPVGAGLYLALTSTWAALQQLFLLTRYPVPTTRADLLRRARLAT